MKNSNYPYYQHPDLHNFIQLLEVNDYHANDIAFSYPGKDGKITKTYQQFKTEVLKLANYFNSNYQNKHIALIGPNTYSWVVSWTAVILSGNLAVAIDKDETDEKIDYLLSKGDVDVIIHDQNYIELQQAAQPKLHFEDLEKLAENYPAATDNLKVDENAPATIFFTSGTTGANKGVMLSQRNIMANIYGATSLFKPDGSVISVLPYHHAFGLITGVIKPYYYGVEVYISASIRAFATDIKEQSPSLLFVVPLFVETFQKAVIKGAKKKGSYEKLEKGIKISNFLMKFGIDLRQKLFKEVLDEFGGKLHFVICGGAYLDQKYIDWFHSIGVEILNGYGITEASPVLAVNRNYYKRAGSVGQICRGDEVKIIDGEICVKGDNIMLGYYNDEEATKEVIIDGFFHTGDLGYVDKDGFLFITGRKKNLIILNNGENISPEDVESFFLAKNEVQECVCFADKGKIIVEIYPNQEVDTTNLAASLKAEYNKNKATNKQVANVILVDEEFPKNNNTKILRNKVIEEYQNDRKN